MVMRAPAANPPNAQAKPERELQVAAGQS